MQVSQTVTTVGDMITRTRMGIRTQLTVMTATTSIWTSTAITSVRDFDAGTKTVITAGTNTVATATVDSR